MLSFYVPRADGAYTSQRRRHPAPEPASYKRVFLPRRNPREQGAVKGIAAWQTACHGNSASHAQSSIIASSTRHYPSSSSYSLSCKEVARDNTHPHPAAGQAAIV